MFFPAVRITVSEDSDLYIPPGAEGRVIVILRNDGVGDLFLISGGDDKNFFQQFEYSQSAISFFFFLLLFNFKFIIHFSFVKDKRIDF